VPIAEHTGLIRPLTSYVLRTALEQCRAWQLDGATLGMAVNLSARSLSEPGLVDDVDRQLGAAGVAPDLLTLEVTEGHVMSDPDRAVGVLRRLRGLGVHLAIDDFGTGYSSLAYLKQLPVDEVKLDRSFVMHMTSDHHDAAIVRSTIELAHNLGLRVVAEGVEDLATWTCWPRWAATSRRATTWPGRCRRTRPPAGCTPAPGRHPIRTPRSLADTPPARPGAHRPGPASYRPHRLVVGSVREGRALDSWGS
jgi:predicted signal transduction protein with EAL and GGDEF domain